MVLMVASRNFANAPKTSTFCPHTVFMCSVWISEHTAIISLYRINWLAFITETESVYCAVRTGSVYTASLTFSNSTFCSHSVFVCFVWISEQTAIISLYRINWLVFITETESVYCAVRTGYLNINFFKRVSSAQKTSCDAKFCVSGTWVWLVWRPSCSCTSHSHH